MRGVALAHRRRSPKPAVFRGGQAPSFIAPLTTTLLPARAVGSRTPTFTRATTAWVEDHEGILRQVPSGAARFHGARLVRNQVTYSQAFENAAWLKLQSGTGSTPVVTDNYAAAPDGTQTAARIQFSLGATPATAMSRIFQSGTDSLVGTVYQNSIYARTTDGSTKTIYMVGSNGANILFELNGTWQRLQPTQSTSASYAQIQFGLDGASGTSDTADILVWGAQVENVTGASVQTASEYISHGVLSAPFHGAGVNGVKYFLTDKSGNRISDSTLKGCLAEGSRQNRCLYSQDFSNAAWVATNATKTNTVSAPDGSTTGYTLTATAANGTVIQNLGVVASASKTFSIWLKRKTGTGNVQMTLDGGATWTTKTITSDWARYSITQTLADEDCGIRIVTSGDAVYVWGAQVETASGFSSYIPTTTAAVTRNADVLKYDSFYATLINAAGSAHAEISRNILDVNGSGIIDLEGDGGTGPLFFSNSTTMQASMHDNTLQASPLGSSTPTVGQIYKSASSWGNSLMRCSSNNGYSIGNDVAFDGSFGAGAFSPGLWIGGGNGGANPMNGMIRNLRLWNTTLSRAALQALTT